MLLFMIIFLPPKCCHMPEDEQEMQNASFTTGSHQMSPNAQINNLRTQSFHLFAQIINSQSLEDTQVGYISQKYSFDKYTLGQEFKPSYTFSSI